MGMSWTVEQQQAIALRNRNILVSAAAGSGKTAVLVERIIQIVADKAHPVDIDRLLVVTFTNAAAGEMRERIRTAIEKSLAAEPDNVHLQRQLTLVHNAQITTIHSFCQYVIRNYFHVIELDPGFRIGDEGEMKLLCGEVAEELLEEAYEKRAADFLHFIECYAAGKTDREITALILQLYQFSRSAPWPETWLKNCKKAYEATDMETLCNTEWMKLLLHDTELLLKDISEQIQEALAIISSEDGPYMYESALKSDEKIIKKLLSASNYLEYSRQFGALDKHERLSAKRDETVSDSKKERVKEIREQIKKSLAAISEQYFYQEAEQMLADLAGSHKAMAVLIDLTCRFAEKFTEKKREKNLCDFNDLEHLALRILVKEEQGMAVPTEVAKQFAEQFEEIMIDEYQDSNLVQEYILTSVSRQQQGNDNIFMVGDVKQSIYRFRLARPELFMEKYASYTNDDSRHQKIELHKNFRSQAQVLADINFIFAQIMTSELGNVAYDDAAALYPGASFPAKNNEETARTELLLLALDTEAEAIAQSGETAIELEARMIAGRIREMVGTELVFDRKTAAYRSAEYRDIVILLRTVSGWADTFAAILGEQGIPAYTGSQSGYFSAVEVQTVLSLLKVIDNPKQEIPLAAVLRSPIGGFTDSELAEIKSSHLERPYEEACFYYRSEGTKSEIREKLNRFFTMLEDFRSRVPYTAMHDLLWYILEQTGYGDYALAMPGGEQRIANLNMLAQKAMDYEKGSYRGLFNFVRYIEQLKKYSVDFGEANTLGEDENTLRIMSIHKSKGLEFPIVFVAGLGKRFNQQDSRSRLVLHPDLGVGCDVIDPDLRIKAPTLLKRLIQRQTANENLGEELRVLYVALTRAKEKLILTGASANLEGRVKKWLPDCERTQSTLSFGRLLGAAAYLDWLMPALLRHRSGQHFLETFKRNGNHSHPLYEEAVSYDLRRYHVNDLVRCETKHQLSDLWNKERLLNWDSQKVYDRQARELLEAALSSIYPWQNSRDIYGKISVSELKRMSQTVAAQEEYAIYQEPEIVPLIPKFMQETETVGGAVRGTVVHKLLEQLDYRREASEEELEAQIAAFCAAGKMTQEEAEMVERPRILGFLQSDLGKRMKQAALAGQLYREQPFVLSVAASHIREKWDTDDQVLVQGMIDAYFYEESEIVLVDYKTDFIKTGQERALLEKYQIQLDFYAEALRRLTGKTVKERLIYSFSLQKELRNI